MSHSQELAMTWEESQIANKYRRAVFKLSDDQRNLILNGHESHLLNCHDENVCVLKIVSRAGENIPRRVCECITAKCLKWQNVPGRQVGNRSTEKSENIACLLVQPSNNFHCSFVSVKVYCICPVLNPFWVRSRDPHKAGRRESLPPWCPCGVLGWGMRPVQEELTAQSRLPKPEHRGGPPSLIRPTSTSPGFIIDMGKKGERSGAS